MGPRFPSPTTFPYWSINFSVLELKRIEPSMLHPGFASRSLTAMRKHSHQVTNSAPERCGGANPSHNLPEMTKPAGGHRYCSKFARGHCVEEPLRLKPDLARTLKNSCKFVSSISEVFTRIPLIATNYGKIRRWRSEIRNALRSILLAISFCSTLFSKKFVRI